MITPTPTNPHQVEKLWGSLFYWKDGIACGVDDDWTHVELRIRYRNTVDLQFQRSENHRFERVTHALDLAFYKGKHARSADFARLIANTGFGV